MSNLNAARSAFSGFTGAIATAGQANCLVEDTEEIWTEQNVRKFAVTAVKYAKI
ncbi:MAG TPA: hypothetical protein VIS96_07760 [Terrimicrobiaceae bacterium]